ncbi:4-amino-4-deoxychorismate lyase [Aeromicrobium flavum]|uniref:4-amino-4-deoxychorismate lyase n=1 Tax=Aeromicrobium flavum TaxID=416568 RepID=A0A512HR94_9ACTN|nr:aminotransferase class IV [Aeromicrobium flavum]GEO87975.1 4-amino-4-deoxychorismate lyase [Aeromicrobium flavum]
MKAWVDGQLLESPHDRALSVLDHGFVVGDGVFETAAVIDGQPFALTRHLDRLVTSAEGLGLGRPDVDGLRQGIEATLAGQELPFGRVRITVTSGPGPLGSPRGDSGLTHVVVTEPAERPGPVSAIATVPWTRNEHGALAGLKTTSYAENAKMVEYARARGASEAVMANTRGDLCEGTGSNVMYVLDGQLVTPTLESGCLAGITRALALEWLSDELDVVERDAPLEVLFEADEVIIVGTTRTIQAISRVDDCELPAPGPITQRAQEIWRAREAESIDP